MSAFIFFLSLPLLPLFKLMFSPLQLLPLSFPRSFLSTQLSLFKFSVSFPLSTSPSPLHFLLSLFCFLSFYVYSTSILCFFPRPSSFLLSFYCRYSCFSLSYTYLLWHRLFSYLPPYFTSLSTSHFPLSTSVSVVLILLFQSSYFRFSSPASVSSEHDLYFPLPTILVILIFFLWFRLFFPRYDICHHIKVGDSPEIVRLCELQFTRLFAIIDSASYSPCFPSVISLPLTIFE